MGYWIFMTCMALLIPGILVAIGSVTRKSAPKNINPIYGYRTSMSMKNKETWEFANKLFGRLAYKCGLWMLVISAVIMLCTLFRSEQVVSIVGTVLVTVQLIPLLGIIPIVEKALKQNFNKDGSRKA